MSSKRIDCEQALRQVFEFIDRELDDNEEKAMQHHLHTCKSCFSRFEFERRLKEKIGELRKDDAGPTLTSRIQSLLKSM